MQITIEIRDGTADCNPSVSEVEIDADYTNPTSWNCKCYEDKCTELAPHLITLLREADYSVCETHLAQTLLGFLYPVGDH